MRKRIIKGLTNGKHHTGKTCKMVKIEWESKKWQKTEVASGRGENEHRKLWRGKEMGEQRRFPAPTHTFNSIQTIEKEKYK